MGGRGGSTAGAAGTGVPAAAGSGGTGSGGAGAGGASDAGDSPVTELRDASVPPAGHDAGPDADADTGDSGASEPFAEPCALSGTETVVHGFDSGLGGAQVTGSGAPELAWNATQGEPQPGALEYTDPAGAAGQVWHDGELGDLSGRRVSLNVRVLSGSGVALRLFVETGLDGRRMHGEPRTPPLSAWSCVRLDLTAPDEVEPGASPTQVVAMGVEITGAGSVRVQLDHIAY